MGCFILTIRRKPGAFALDTGQVTGQVAGQVQRLLAVCEGPLSRSELQERLGLKHRDSFNEAYLQPALAAGIIEMTIPDKPRSSKQKYRVTAKGRTFREQLQRD